jgi:hypothetical protein
MWYIGTDGSGTGFLNPTTGEIDGTPEPMKVTIGEFAGTIAPVAVAPRLP